MLTFGARRPRLALAAWLTATALLGVIGHGAGSHLSRTSLLVPGTPSAHEAQVFAREFGSGVEAPIVLSGPARLLDREGPALAARLSKVRGAQVVSAWDGGQLGRSLRPSRTRGIVLVGLTPQSHAPIVAAARTLRHAVYATVRAPVHAYVTGVDALGADLVTASLQAVHQAELIAIPVLVVVLLLVFGSPLAAAIPIALGFGTVLAAFGVIALLSSVLPLTALATIAASMMGLALGVDYSLLVVARFRDELRDPRDPADVRRAAGVAALRAGRTATFAGGAIATLMLCALAAAAGTLLLSAVLGVIVVAAISVAFTVLATPAALVVLGRRLAPRRLAAAVTVVEHPAGSTRARFGRSTVAVGLASAALVALGMHAMSLATGPPSALQLPPSSKAVQDFTRVSRDVGTGWVTPFEMLIVAHSGAITTLPRLDAIARTQRELVHDPDVADVVGPSELARRAAPLTHAESSVGAANRSIAQSARLIGGLNADLGQAAAGAGHVEAGFGTAAAAVARLAAGGGGGGGAAAALSAGVLRVAQGSRQLDGALAQAASGAAQLAGGGRQLAAGAGGLASGLGSESSAAAAAGPRLQALAQTLHSQGSGLDTLATDVAQLSAGPSAAATQLATARQALEAMPFLSRLNSRYRTALDAVTAAQSALSGAQSTAALAGQLREVAANDEQASAQVQTLAGDAVRLSSAIAQQRAGVAQLPTRISGLEREQSALAAGIERLASSGRALTGGLGTLASGTATLGGRLQELESGVARVASGLQSERVQAGGLASTLGAGARSAAGGSKSHPHGSGVLKTLASNPGFFSSGYLVLAALEGSPAAQQAGVDFIVNVARNGEAARMEIIPRSPASSAATGALRARLERAARALAAATGAQVLIGGPAAELQDYTTASTSRVPLLIGVLMAATLLLLIVVFRSLFAPLVGVLLNLLSVAAAFGALALLSGGRHPLIGGPGYVDALSVSAMFAVVFALSLDYQVFLLMRMREGWIRTGSTSAGVDYGVSRTARVVAGAAAIMASVFLAFSSAGVATIRQLGVGLAVAIVIDATIVRLVLLPYVLRLGGKLTWWLPGWLDRRLPTIDIGAERRSADRRPADDRVASPAPSSRPERIVHRDALALKPLAEAVE
jgi:RND superfamily putative drug exporter